MRNSFCSIFHTLKRCYMMHTARFYICLSVVVVGAISAMFKELPEVTTANFIYNICINGAVNPLVYIIRLCILNCILFLCAYMAIYHYFVFLLNIGVLYAYSIIIFRIVYGAIATSPLYGIIYLLYILPIVIVGFFAYITTLFYVYEMSGYMINKRAKINVSIYTSRLARLVVARCLCSTIFAVVLHLLIHLIAVLIMAM